jgi:hypothetical protein
MNPSPKPRPDALKERRRSQHRQGLRRHALGAQPAVEGGDVSVDVELGYPAKSQIEPLRAS